MNDTIFEDLELYSSIQNDIEERLQKATDGLEKNQNNLNDKSQKVGFLERISINNTIKEYKEKIRQLTELKQALYKLRFDKSEKYNLPSTIKNQFSHLITMLPSNEIDELRITINNNLNKINNNRKKTFEINLEEAKKILIQLKLPTKELLVYKGLQLRGRLTYDSAIKQIEKNYIEEKTAEYIFLSNESKEEMKNSSSPLLERIEEMISSNQLQETKTTKKIIANFSKIKEEYQKQERINQILMVISNIKYELNNIKDADLNMIITYLEKLEKKYTNELAKTTQYLSQFNFDDIKQQIANNSEKEQQSVINSKIQKYEELVYELQKLVMENPTDTLRIQELENQMKKYAIESGLTKDELDIALENGKAKYKIEKESKIEKSIISKDKVELENEQEKALMVQLREYAIKELESSGIFKERYEYQNGDVYTTKIDREKLIQDKIEELKKIAEMTPEERGLHEMKKEGLIGASVTVSELTEQQKADFRYAFRDESYSFVSDYKKLKTRKESKSDVNRIYKEYIKYRARLIDKSNYLSFTEYAKQMYQIENMSEIMVDQEVLEESMKGMGK